MSRDVITALSQFHHELLALHQQQHNSLPTIEQDDDWPSPCEQGLAAPGISLWQPIASDNSLSFAGLESALGLTLHSDIVTFYTSFFSHHLAATCADGALELLQAWNRDDFDRLQENMIGHILAKRRNKQPETFFIAATDDDEIIVSVINDSGEVWAERIGKNPHRKLADSLPEFIAQLTPVVSNT